MLIMKRSSLRRPLVDKDNSRKRPPEARVQRRRTTRRHRNAQSRAGGAERDMTIMGYQILAAIIRGFMRLRSAFDRSLTYHELMELTDRQLEDIGLTRNLIETVLVQGGEEVAAKLPDGAVRTSLLRAANTNRMAGAA
jgi:uncharacterized protein YjiS (DUF1127 family)